MYTTVVIVIFDDDYAECQLTCIIVISY